MFLNYQNFITDTLYNIFHPNCNSFADYIQVVFSGMLVIISGLVVIAIIAGILILPFIVYKKCVKNIEVQINETYIRYRKDYEGDSKDIEALQSKQEKLENEKLKYIILVILLSIVIYIPMILPIFMMIIDFLGLLYFSTLIVILLLIGFIIFDMWFRSNYY
ncbi:MAG: hypothetical protein K0R54_821 [Clostridiaceae bacterium]|jgi:uncharacterized membrane protein (DUF106 family)|nr:hypothetical protein [Clostridiaceae bacterium]